MVSIRPRKQRPAGSALVMIILALVIIGVSIGGVVYFVSQRKVDPSKLPMTATATRDEFDHIVLEHGEIESSSNVEVACEVKSKNGNGTAIIWVIAEGTVVKKGDKLIELDSSAIQDELQAQNIVVNNARALKIAADALHEQALIAKTEYLEGLFKQEEQTIRNEILIAEEKLSRLQETAKYSQRLASRGFQTALQLKADLFAVEQAQLELDLAQNKLDTLRNHTKRKMEIGLNSDIEATKARVDAEDDSLQEELKKQADIQRQLENCTIKAPQDGQVVYANIVSRRGGSEFVVEAGAMVRERQTIVRLPDPTQMQVKATINESRITLVEEGMPVSIRVGAFDNDAVLPGEVKKVNRYAEPGSWFSSQVKEYACFVDILNPPAEIRTGMTAEIRIQVDHLEDVLQVPVQALCEHKGKMFCLVQNGINWDTREVEMGATNDKQVVILGGLQEGDVVALNPRGHADLLDLPDLPDPPATAGGRGRGKKQAGPGKKKKNRQTETAGAGSLGDQAGGG